MAVASGDFLRVNVSIWFGAFLRVNVSIWFGAFLRVAAILRQIGDKSGCFLRFRGFFLRLGELSTRLSPIPGISPAFGRLFR